MTTPVHDDELTDDEIRFLSSSTAMKRKREIQRKSSEEMRDRKPKLPVVTMVVVAVLGVVVSIGVWTVLESFSPYVKAASSLTALKESGAIESEDSIEQAMNITRLYGFRGPSIGIIIGVTLLIEIILYVQWALRMHGWEQRERARRRKRRRLSKSSHQHDDGRHVTYDEYDMESDSSE